MFIAAALLLCALAGALHAATGLEIPSTPGYHTSLPLPDSKVCTYDLYLPPTYDPKSKDRYPVLIVLGYDNMNGRNWFDEMRLVQWAEAKNSLVVVVNLSFSDFVNSPERRGQRDITVMDHYMKMIDAIPQAHPNIRFVVNAFSDWGSQHAWAVASRFPQKVAGIIIGPSYRILNANERLAPLDKNLALAVLHLDATAYMKSHPRTMGFFYNDNYDAWEERVGKVLSSPPLGTYPILRMPSSDFVVSAKSLAPALNFLLDAAYLSNPNLVKVEADKARTAIVARVNKAAALEDSEARFAALDPLVHIPSFIKSPEGKQALTAWTKAVYEAGDKKTLYPRYAFFRALYDFDPLFASEPERTVLKKKLADLQADPTVKSEIAGEDALAALRRSAVRALSDGNVDLAKESLADLDALIAKHPKSTVADDAAAIRQLVQNEVSMLGRIRRPGPTTRNASNPAPSDVTGPAN